MKPVLVACTAVLSVLTRRGTFRLKGFALQVT